MLLKYFQKLFASFLILFIFSFPMVIIAASTALPAGGTQTTGGNPAGGYPTGNTSGATKITNPIGNIGNIVQLVDALINVAIKIGIPFATLA